MIVIIDYGAGNLFSVQNALNYLGFENKISKKKVDLENADALILPGVGAFPDAMRMLRNTDLIDTIKQQVKSKPLLGICLGMQMLFEKGYEFGETDGLGLIKGSVKRMTPKNLTIPHMGWNKLEKNAGCELSKAIGDNDYVYFVHSFAADCDEKNVAAYCDYYAKIPALVFEGNVYGAQFHPEKSGAAGLGILKAFSELVK